VSVSKKVVSMLCATTPAVRRIPIAVEGWVRSADPSDRFKTRFCGCCLAGVVVSNLAGDLDVYVVCFRGRRDKGADDVKVQNE
jgi:hypothetical protein